jgi:hypothetical protein
MMELVEILMGYRSTPHPTTVKPPYEMMMNQKY